MQRDRQSIVDIIDSIHLIFEYTQGEDFQELENNTKNLDAVIRRFTIIGEATKRISTEFRDRHPEIPWKQMAGLRDVIVHEYDDINFNIIRDVIEIELPPLLQLLQTLLF